MPFITTVTRRKEDGGITLRAKIVTPKHKIVRRKNYPICIKKNVLSDYECCVIDNANAKTRISNKNEMDALCINIDGMDTYGNHDTKISYLIENDPESSTNLSDYLAPSGEIIQRPKYNPSASTDVSGYLVISVKKNDEEVISKIPVTIKQYSAAEVLNDNNLFNIQTIWNAIKGDNDPANVNGYMHIMNSLDFSGIPSSSTKSEIPVRVNITIEDSLTVAAAPGGSIAEKRISDSGDVTRLDYEHGARIYSSNPSLAVPLNGQGASSGSTNTIIGRINSVASKARVCFAIGGIKIIAKLSLGDIVNGKTVTITGRTLTKFLKKSDVEEALRRSLRMYQLNTDGSVSSIAYFKDTGVITIPKVAGKTTSFKVFEFVNDDAGIYDDTTKLASTSNLSLPSLAGIMAGMQVQSVSISDFDNIGTFNPADFNDKFVRPGEQPTDNLTNGAYISDGTVYHPDNLFTFGIWHDGWIADTVGPQKFAIVATITIPGNVYSEDGIEIASSRSTSTLTLSRKFMMT